MKLLMPPNMMGGGKLLIVRSEKSIKILAGGGEGGGGSAIRPSVPGTCFHFRVFPLDSSAFCWPWRLPFFPGGSTFVFRALLEWPVLGWEVTVGWGVGPGV